jgi:GNAT superfamily N-acetyltransferase
VSARITLRRAKKRDLPLIEPWYEEAARTADGGSIPEGDPDLGGRFDANGLWVITKPRDPLPIGVLDEVPDWPAKGWATIEFIALAAGQRGWGYGSEAVREFEEKHRRSSHLAQIDPRNGLALYFWLRLGYRPAHSGEVFWRAPDEGGIIAMIRLPE